MDERPDGWKKSIRVLFYQFVSDPWKERSPILLLHTTYYETITGPNKRNPIWEAKAHVSLKLGHNKIPKEVGTYTYRKDYLSNVNGMRSS